MRPFNTSYVFVGGIVAVSAAGMAATILSNGPTVDLGGSGQTEIRGSSPTPINDPMKPVSQREASRRAAANQQQADERGKKGAYVAPTVVAETRGPQQGDLPTDAPADSPEPPMVEPPAVKVEPQPVAAEPPPVSVSVTPPPPPPVIIYRDVPMVPTASPDQIAKINEQIDALIKPAPGGFVVRSFDKGERPQPVTQAAAVTGPFGSGIRHAMVARTGDVAYAVLDRGFNSDDPAAPVFATITDLDALQRPGPLNGIRLMGQIVYSATQASIRFGTMILQDGRQAPMQAVAITVDQARTGVADDIDEHTLSRYSSLAVASLLQGAGQIGQQLTQLNNNVLYGNGVALQSRAGMNWGAAGLGMALPFGQALTAVAARNFNQAPTLSSPTNFPIGIVFLQPVVLPIYGGQPWAAAQGRR